MENSIELSSYYVIGSSIQHAMFNPAYLFTTDLLNSFIEKKVEYIVRQTYKRGYEPGLKGSFQFSQYFNKEDANKHYNAISNDKARFLYDLSVPDHVDKLRIAASQPQGFKNYCNMIALDKEKEATKIYKQNTIRYLRSANINWDLSGRVTIYPKLYFQLGELYIRITHDGITIRPKFEEIENS